MKKTTFALSVLLLLTGMLSAQTITKIPYDSLPAPVREQVLKKYSKYKVSDIKKSVDNTGTVNYLVEARMQQNQNTVSVVSLVYFPSGTLLSSKKEKEVSYTGSERQRSSAPSSDGHNHQH